MDGSSRVLNMLRRHINMLISHSIDCLAAHSGTPAPRHPGAQSLRSRLGAVRAATQAAELIDSRSPASSNLC